MPRTPCQRGVLPESAWTDQDPGKKLTAASLEAAALCRTCPRIDACRETAVDLVREGTFVVYGIWAGDTAKNLARLAPANCPTLPTAPVDAIAQQRHLSRRALAALAGVDASNLCRWFKRGTVTRRQAETLAAAVGVPASTLWPDQARTAA